MRDWCQPQPRQRMAVATVGAARWDGRWHQVVVEQVGWKKHVNPLATAVAIRVMRVRLMVITPIMGLLILRRVGATVAALQRRRPLP